MIDGSWDRELLIALNRLVGADRRYFWELANNPLVRGFPVFFPLLVLWFIGDYNRRRSRMLAGLLAVCVATVASVWIQFHFPINTRPILDPSLNLQNIDPRWKQDWDRVSSFPSDTSTLYFGIAAVILVENVLVGLLCFLWVLVVIGVPRVMFGWHYPSDVLGAMILGPACVFLFVELPFLPLLFERILMLFKDRMYIIHALLFIFLADASNTFDGLHQLERILAHSSR
jgi:undecaprenyl-diphosphatase